MDCDLLVCMSCLPCCVWLFRKGKKIAISRIVCWGSTCPECYNIIKRTVIISDLHCTLLFNSCCELAKVFLCLLLHVWLSLRTCVHFKIIISLLWSLKAASLLKVLWKSITLSRSYTVVETRLNIVANLWSCFSQEIEVFLSYIVVCIGILSFLEIVIKLLYICLFNYTCVVLHPSRYASGELHSLYWWFGSVSDNVTHGLTFWFRMIKFCL